MSKAKQKPVGNVRLKAMQEMATFVKERNEALLSLDEQKLIDYGNKWGVNWDKLPKHEGGFWAAVHMARTAVAELPMEERKKSKLWLLEHGYQSFDDGDIKLP